MAQRAAAPARQPRCSMPAAAPADSLAQLGAAGARARSAAASSSIDAGAAIRARAKSGCRDRRRARSTRLPLRRRSRSTRSSAPTCCAIAASTEARRSREFRRCLKPGGVLVLNLPAYRWLFSAHDVGRRQCAALWPRRAARGCSPRRASPRSQARYWNSDPLSADGAAGVSCGARRRRSDVGLLPAPVERLFFACIALEGACRARASRLPFGGSILATAVKTMTAPLALSIVIPVYNGARQRSASSSARLRSSTCRAGTRSCWSTTAAPTTASPCAAISSRGARVPMTLVNLARNYGEHNAVMAGLRQARGAHVITMDDDLQNPPGEVLRLLASCADERQGRDLYPLCAASSMPRWRNLGSRFTNRVADCVLDKPKGLYLSSFRCMSAFVAREIDQYEGPFPYVDGLIMQVTQSDRRARGRASAAHGRAQQLHAAAARAAVAQSCSSISR